MTADPHPAGRHPRQRARPHPDRPGRRTRSARPSTSSRSRPRATARAAALAQIGGTGRVRLGAARGAAGRRDRRRRALLQGPADRAGRRHRRRGRPGARGPARRARRPRRAHPRRAAGRRAGRHRLAAAGRPAAGARAWAWRSSPIRGNVDTRLGKVAAGEVDAVVLAYAGLRRLGRGYEATEVLDPIQVLPAPGAGCAGGRVPHVRRRGPARCSPGSTTPDTRSAVAAERALLAALEAGCSAPVGACVAEIAEGDDRHRSFPSRIGDRDRRQRRRPAVGHRPDHRCRRSRTAACRRTARRRRRSR